MITSWRIVAAEWADEAFSGEGSRKNPGRWHLLGMRMVYTSSSVSLATLELLVNTERVRRLRDYAVVSCVFPDAIVEELDRSRLPENWRQFPPPTEVTAIGAEWYESQASCVLAVSSAVTPEEVNYLINPEHEHFSSVKIGASRPFRLDWRLVN